MQRVGLSIAACTRCAFTVHSLTLALIALSMHEYYFQVVHKMHAHSPFLKQKYNLYHTILERSRIKFMSIMHTTSTVYNVI